MKIKVDGYHVRNICRRCYWFVLHRDNKMCYCYKHHAETAPFASCEKFDYSAQADAVYSIFDRGKKL